MTDREFLDALDGIIADRHMLQHPLYQMWNRGELTLDMIKQYALEYYHQVYHFPTFVSATHARCAEDMEVRQMLLENLIEEEHGPNNHPELWRRFGDALGITREEMSSRQYLPHTRQSVQILRDLAFDENPAVGLAALYAYESQIPEVAATKIEGLIKYYGLNCEDALIFFQVHEHADVIHRQVTREALLRMCRTEEQQRAALDSAQEAADAINLLLDGVYERWCSPSQVISS